MVTVTVDAELLQAIMTDYNDLLKSYMDWINTDDLLWIQYRHADMQRRIDQIGDILTDALVGKPGTF